jgi:diadenosine tetraphosphate (Ap4A) HIT family hydrolase
LQAVDKGPISETHILVLSVEHYPNTITLQPAAFNEVHQFVAALRKAYASRGLHLVGFERCGFKHDVQCFLNDESKQ